MSWRKDDDQRLDDEGDEELDENVSIISILTIAKRLADIEIRTTKIKKMPCSLPLM